MDRNAFIGLGLLALALVLLFTQPAPEFAVPDEPPSTQRSAAQRGPSLGEISRTEGSAAPSLMTPVEEALLMKTSQAPAATKEQAFIIENDHIAVTFTTLGGAIQEVAFKDYAAHVQKRDEPSMDPYRFNSRSMIPALSLHIADAAGTLRAHEDNYRLLSLEKSAIRFAFELAPGIRVLREYRLSRGDASQQDPYIITHETRFINESDVAFSLNKLYVNVGTARPSVADPYGQSLNFGYYNGDSAEFIPLNDFEAREGYLGIGLLSRPARPPLTQEVKPVLWASIKNQFFTGIVTPKEPGVGIHARAIELLPSGDEALVEQGITGSLAFALGAVTPGEERGLKLDYYVGPKEFRRLQSLSKEQDEVMQFPPLIGFVSKALLSFMLLLYSLVPNWGWTIIILTVCIKVLFWPLTAKTARSQKAMQRIQQPLQALREKYKDSPQKLQAEMLKLFKQHKVNPASGCLPILIQMPIFIALFYTLRSASELRFADFIFWIKDLSQPDTVAEIAGFPINILPLLMGGTMFLQMHMTPSTSAVDSMQQKVLKFLPFVFLIICYNFSSGLVLYWTVQNLLTILQQHLTNKQKDLEPVLEVAVSSHKKKPKRYSLSR